MQGPLRECCPSQYHSPHLESCGTDPIPQTEVVLTRPEWDAYFLDGASWVATRADCRRRQCGAVIVKDNRIMATGYNGGPAKGPSCLAGECPRGLQSRDEVAPGSSYDTGAGVCIALHAEQNAIMYCSREDRLDATIYVNQEPCGGCARMIFGSGIRRAVWPDGEFRLSGNRWMRTKRTGELVEWL